MILKEEAIDKPDIGSVWIKKALSHLDSPQKKNYKKLLHSVGKSISDYGMIRNGDRIMVAVSGGKDSLALLFILSDLQRKAPVHFEILAYTLDQKQPGFDSSGLISYYENLGVEYYIGQRDTYAIVTEKIDAESTYCSLCSRLRRGILYDEAVRLRANKIALGHHADDAMETFFLNIFYTGRMASMPPVLLSDDKRNTVIRPLILCDEFDIAEFAKAVHLPIIPCNLCGSQDNLQRKRMKKLIADEYSRNPVMRQSLKAALGNVQGEFLWDKKFFNRE